MNIEGDPKGNPYVPICTQRRCGATVTNIDDPKKEPISAQIRAEAAVTNRGDPKGEAIGTQGSGCGKEQR